MSGSITISDYTAFGVADDTFFLGHPSYPVNIRSNGTTQINGNTVYHSGNLSLSTLAGASSVGGASTPIYYNGSSLVAGNALGTMAYQATTAYASAPVFVYGNAATGVFVQTNIAAASNTMFQFNIEGITYSPFKNPFFSIVTGYNYNSWDSIINYSAINYGQNFGNFSVFNYGGYLCLWFAGDDNFQTYRVTCYTQLDRVNHVTSCSNVAKPSSGITREVTIAPVQSYNSRNSNLSTVPWACSTLTLAGAITGATTISASGSVSVTHSSNMNGFYVNGTSHKLGFIIGTGNVNRGIYDNNAGAWLLYFDASNTILNKGNVGIGTTSPAQKLHVAGNILATGAITAGSASDARLKANIQSLSAEAAKRIVMALNPVTFTWNEKATELYDRYKGDDLGMIAQEVEPYLPQAVGTIFEKYKRLDYTKVVSPLVKVAQDHESRIRQLEAENRELRKEVERLRMN